MPEENRQEGLHQDRFQINFEETTHTYTVNGKVLPSVTQIMHEMSENHYAAIPPAVLEKAADRGTRVHKAVEMYEKFGIETDDPEIKAYLVSYRIAKSIEGFVVDQNEIIMTNGQYCGTIDILGRLNGRIIIIDLKATSQVNQKLLETQLAGYEVLAVDNGIFASGHYVLQLKPDGYKFKQITPDISGWIELLSGYQDAHPDETIG